MEGEQEGRLHPLEGQDDIRIEKQLVLMTVNLTETFPIGLSRSTQCASLRSTSPIWPFPGGISSRISWKLERAPCSHFDHSDLGGFLLWFSHLYTFATFKYLYFEDYAPLFSPIQVIRLEEELLKTQLNIWTIIRKRLWASNPVEIVLTTFCLISQLLLFEGLLQTTRRVWCFHMSTSEKT